MHLLRLKRGNMSQIFDALQRSEAERNGKDAGSRLRVHRTAATRRTSIAATSRIAAATRQMAGTQPLAHGNRRGSRRADAEPERGPAACSAVLTGAVLPAEERVRRADAVRGLERIAVSADSHLVSVPDTESPAGEAFHLLGVRLRHLRRQTSAEEGSDYEHDSAGRQEHGCGEPGVHAGPADAAEGTAAGGRCPAADTIEDLRTSDTSRVSANGLMARDRSSRACTELEGPGIWILPAGQATGELAWNCCNLGGRSPMMEQLTNWFDWVVIDSPPILPLADTSVWTNMADGILLVDTSGHHAEAAIEAWTGSAGNPKADWGGFEQCKERCALRLLLSPDKSVTKRRCGSLILSLLLASLSILATQSG